MWKCPNCGRIFESHGQVHSCQTKPLDDHFKNKDLPRAIFNELFRKINEQIGECEIVSIPCCIYLCGRYDFLALLPRQNSLEVRFGLDRKLYNSRVIQVVPVSKTSYKNCIELKSTNDIDDELMRWIGESYQLRK